MHDERDVDPTDWRERQLWPAQRGPKQRLHDVFRPNNVVGLSPEETKGMRACTTREMQIPLIGEDANFGQLSRDQRQRLHDVFRPNDVVGLFPDETKGMGTCTTREM